MPRHPPAKKDCTSCKTPSWPMHLKEGLCKACQKAKATAQADVVANHVRAALASAEASCKEYGAEGLPEKIKDRLMTALLQPASQACLEICQKALASLQTHLLSEWSAGRIRGKPTVNSLEADAKKAESLANMLESKGQHDQAVGQRERADRLAEEAKALRKSMTRAKDTEADIIAKLPVYKRGDKIIDIDDLS